MKRFTVVKHHKGYWIVKDELYHYFPNETCVFRENGVDNIFDKRFNPLHCKPNVRECEEAHSIAGDTSYERAVDYCNRMNSCDGFTIAEIKEGDEMIEYANTENYPPDVYEQKELGVVHLVNWRKRK